jgi:uncharacterized protein with gpF-like domain
MNARQREQYWIKVERLRRQLDNKYSSLFNEAVRKDLEKFARDVREIGPQAAVSGLGAYAWNTSMMNIMEKLYKEAGVVFANASYRAVGIESRKASNPFGFNTDWMKDIVSYLVQYGLTLVSYMTQTTKKKLAEIVNVAIAEGKTTQEIVDIIMEEGGYSMMRATRIARTEVMRSSNYAAYIGAQKHAFEVDKVWISARDSRTRRIPRDFFDHYEMDGQQVGFDEPFVGSTRVGGVVTAAIPGDPKAPVGFTVNCRCTVGFIPKRDANGALIMKN